MITLIGLPEAIILDQILETDIIRSAITVQSYQGRAKRPLFIAELVSGEISEEIVMLARLIGIVEDQPSLADSFGGLGHFRQAALRRCPWPWKRNPGTGDWPLWKGVGIVRPGTAPCRGATRGIAHPHIGATFAGDACRIFQRSFLEFIQQLHNFRNQS